VLQFADNRIGRHLPGKKLWTEVEGGPGLRYVLRMQAALELNVRLDAIPITSSFLRVGAGRLRAHSQSSNSIRQPSELTPKHREYGSESGYVPKGSDGVY
jgi:hypothetical protein